MWILSETKRRQISEISDLDLAKPDGGSLGSQISEIFFRMAPEKITVIGRITPDSVSNASPIHPSIMVDGLDV